MLAFQLRYLFSDGSIKIEIRIIHKSIDFFRRKSDAYKQFDAPYPFDVLITVITIFIRWITTLVGRKELFFLVISKHITSYAKILNHPFY